MEISPDFVAKIHYYLPFTYTVNAVSYTHLDVYKRQEHGSAQVKSRWAYVKRLNIELDRKIAGAVTKYAKENHADIIVFEYLETKAVSYTHLS